MTLNIDITNAEVTYSGYVKWFDTIKGFGFVTVEGDTDVLLSANVLRNYGQSSIAEGSFVELSARVTKRGMQAIEVFSITAPKCNETAFETFALPRTPLVPGRVKWFDKSKGFGFANEFGNSQDVFLHIDILRECGLADLQQAEAISMRVTERNDGLLATEIHSWNYAADNH